MRFEKTNAFPGLPSQTPGSCFSCGIGYLRDGETGVVMTDWWPEGVIILCEACAAEVGRLVPCAKADSLQAELADAKAAVAEAHAAVEAAHAIIRSQRAEMALVPPEPPAPAPEAPAPAKRAAKR